MRGVVSREGIRTDTGRLKLDRAQLALGGLLVTITLLKLTVFGGQPLTIDEVWTGMIAGQSSFAGLVRECQRDVNGPLAYLISWLWAHVSGLSNGALRAPSLLFACAAPLLALAPHRLANRTVRYTWAVLLACWLPGLIFAEQARCYTLVFLLATANATAFASLLRRPSLALAFLWTSVSAVFILSHYVAGLLVGFQGLAYLAVHRGKGFKSWPAALLFCPPLACMWFQASSLAAFAGPKTGALPPMTVADLLPTGALLLGGAVAWPFAAMWAGTALIVTRRSPLPSTGAGEGASVLVVAAVTAVLAVAACLGIGLVRPVVSPRFMTIFAPGVLLGLALMADRVKPAWRQAPAVLAAGAFALAVTFSWVSLLVSPPSPGSMFSFEPAVQALMAGRPRRLIFFWDNPASASASGDQLAEVGNFLFKRAGRPLPVDVVRWEMGSDPNRLILSQAKGSGDAILWLYDRHVPGSLVLTHAPAIDHQDPRWTCHDFGDNAIGIIACHWRASA